MKKLILAIRLLLRPIIDTLFVFGLWTLVLGYLSGCASNGQNPWAHVGDGLINASHQSSSVRKNVYCSSYQASGQVYTTCQ